MSHDCQKNQVLPNVSDQAAYYSRQLFMYNFTIVVDHALKEANKGVFIYTWTEDRHDKGE